MLLNLNKYIDNFNTKKVIDIDIEKDCVIQESPDPVTSETVIDTCIKDDSEHLVTDPKDKEVNVIKEVTQDKKSTVIAKQSESIKKDAVIFETKQSKKKKKLIEKKKKQKEKNKQEQEQNDAKNTKKTSQKKSSLNGSEKEDDAIAEDVKEDTIKEEVKADDVKEEVIENTEETKEEQTPVNTDTHKEQNTIDEKRELLKQKRKRRKKRKQEQKMLNKSDNEDDNESIPEQQMPLPPKGQLKKNKQIIDPINNVKIKRHSLSDHKRFDKSELISEHNGICNFPKLLKSEEFLEQIIKEVHKNDSIHHEKITNFEMESEIVNLNVNVNVKNKDSKKINHKVKLTRAEPDDSEGVQWTCEGYGNEKMGKYLNILNQIFEGGLGGASLNEVMQNNPIDQSKTNAEIDHERLKAVKKKEKLRRKKIKKKQKIAEIKNNIEKMDQHLKNESNLAIKTEELLNSVSKTINTISEIKSKPIPIQPVPPPNPSKSIQEELTQTLENWPNGSMHQRFFKTLESSEIKNFERILEKDFEKYNSIKRHNLEMPKKKIKIEN